MLLLTLVLVFVVVTAVAATEAQSPVTWSSSASPVTSSQSFASRPGSTSSHVVHFPLVNHPKCSKMNPTKECGGKHLMSTLNLMDNGVITHRFFQHAIHGFSATLNETQVKWLEQAGAVVEPNYYLRLQPHTVTPLEGTQRYERQPTNVTFHLSHKTKRETCQLQSSSPNWGLNRIGMSAFNDDLLSPNYPYPGSAGAGVVAYIIDTGIRITHKEFEGRASFGFKAESAWSDTDRNGHGTHVASTVAGATVGVAKKAEVVAVKVLSDSGDGTYDGFIAGIDYVAGHVHRQGSNKKCVSNLSLGGPKSQAINAAVDAMHKICPAAVAAGNENMDACLTSPASAKLAVSVGSTALGSRGWKEVDIKSSFSNYGSCVDILAPGSSIYGAWCNSDTSMTTISGTSMASPHVCGIMALYSGAGVASNQVAQTVLQQSGVTQATFPKKTTNRFAYSGCS